MVHEAQTAMRVIARLSDEASFRCEHYHWTSGKPPPWPANRPFQAQIPRAREFDYVIYLAGDRVGSPLPDGFLNEGLVGFDDLDGHFEKAFSKLLRTEGAPLPLTGTIYEVLDALLAFRRSEGRCPQLFPFVRNPGDDAERVTRFTEISKEQNVPFGMAEYSRQVAWTEHFLGSEFLRGAEVTRFKTRGQFAEVFEAAMRTVLGLEKPKPINELPGLVAYRIEDRGKFFGFRERIAKVVSETQRRVAQEDAGPPFVVIHGESGTGKSSLLQGGVLPRLPVGPRDRQHIVLRSGDVLQPKENRIAALADALRQELRPEQSEQSMAGEAGDDPGQHERMMTWLRERTEALKPARLVISIDQMEAVLDDGDPAAQAAAGRLVSLLFDIAEKRLAAVLMTIRTDRKEALRRMLGPERAEAACWYVNEPLELKELIEIVEETAARMDPPLHPEDREILCENARTFIARSERDAKLLPFVSIALVRLLEEVKRVNAGRRPQELPATSGAERAQSGAGAPSEIALQPTKPGSQADTDWSQRAGGAGAFEPEKAASAQPVAAAETQRTGRILEDRKGAR